MNCPSCGTTMSDGAKFCPKCGTKIGAAAGTPGGTAPGQKKPVKTPREQKPPKKQSGKGPLIFLVVILLLMACVGGGYVGYQIYQKFTASEPADSGWGSSDSDRSEADEDRDERKDAGESGTGGEQPENGADQSAGDSPASTAGQEGGAASLEAAEATTAALDAGALSTTAAWDANTSSTTAAWDINTTAASAADGEYVLPDSSTRYLAEADISGLNSEQLRLARNEIYARHGRKFKDEALQAYFDSKTWYTGTIDPSRFSDDAMLNDIERKNLELIKAREAVLNK